MHPNNPAIGQTRWIVLLKLALFVLLGIYIADCFSPLRLHYDSVRYLAIKDCLELGCPATSDAAKDYFPFGYTATLLVLSKLGILSSFTIVFVNCFFLAVCLYFTAKTFSKSNRILLFVLVLINWLVVKFVAHPLSEMQYLFFSSGSLYFFTSFTKQRKWRFLVLSLFFGWLSFVTKTVGVALVGAILLSLLWEFRASQIAFFKKYKLVIISAVLLMIVAVIFLAKQLGLSHYLGVLQTHLQEAPLLTRLQWRFTEWGEMFLNTPANKAVSKFGMFAVIGFIACGIIIYSWFLINVFSKRSGVPVVVIVYFLLYSIIMFNWPFADPRFWVPLIPLIAACVLRFNLNDNILIKIASRVILTVYVAFGVFAAAYMLYSSFNEKFFAVNQANGSYRKEYETHFFNPQAEKLYTTNSVDTIEVIKNADTSETINPYILGLLERYSR